MGCELGERLIVGIGLPASVRSCGWMQYGLRPPIVARSAAKTQHFRLHRETPYNPRMPLGHEFKGLQGIK